MDVRGLGLSEEDLKALGYQVRDQETEEGQRPSPSPPRGGDSPLRMWVWTVVILLVLGWGASSNRSLPDPVPANRPDTVFSSARAMSQLVEIARRPHPPGSLEHDRVRAHLVDRFRALGLHPEVQTTPWVSRESGTVQAVTVRNIVVPVPGRASTGTVALTAHYDSAPLSPGAGDNGIGVTAILETVRALASSQPLRNDLLIILTDGGPLGLSGLRAFVEHHPLMAEVSLVISVEMRGVGGPALTYESSPENGRMVEVLAGANPRPAATSLTRALPGSQRFSQDLTPFRQAEIPGVTLAAHGGEGSHHQVIDRAGEVSEKTLQHHGTQLLALTRDFGGRDLGTTGLGAGPPRSYLTLPWVGVLHYPTDWSPLLSLGLIGVWILLVAFHRFRGASYKAALVGLLMAVGVVAGSAALGWGFFAGVRGLHPEYGLVESAFFRDGLHHLALSALVVGLVTGTYGLTRRWFGPADLLLGALALPLGLAAWWGFRVPMGAMPLQWAIALSLLSAGLVLALGSDGRWRGWAWGCFLLLSAGIMALLVPSLELVTSTLTFRGAPWIGAAVALGLLLILPVMEWLLKPKGWLFPSLAVALGTGLVIAATPAVQGAQDHPEFTSLILLVDGELAGPVVSRDSLPSDSVPPEARRVAGRWLTIPGRGEEWAQSWVAERETGPTDPGDLLLPPQGGFVVAGTGPETHMPLPSLWVLEDTLTTDGRHLRVAIRSHLGAEMVGVNLVDPGAEITRVAGVGWGPDGGSEPVRSLTHWGRPQDSLLTVEIRTDPRSGPMELQILEHHLRPREVLGEDFFRRDESLIANGPAGSDRIVQRTRARIPASGPAPGHQGGENR